MKKIAVIAMFITLNSWAAQAQTLECQSKSNQLRIELQKPLEKSVVSINGIEQTTGTASQESGLIKLTVMDFEQPSAAILTFPEYEIKDEPDFLVIDVEYLGAPGTETQTEQVVCQKAR